MTARRIRISASGSGRMTRRSGCRLNPWGCAASCRATFDLPPNLRLVAAGGFEPPTYGI